MLVGPAAPRRGLLSGIFSDLLGTVVRMVVLAMVIVLLLVAMFVGGFALLGKAIELIPDSPSTTTTTAVP